MIIRFILRVFNFGGIIMFCKNCGNKINDGARFCPYCHNEIFNSTKHNTSNKKGKKTVVITAVAVILVIALGIGAFSIFYNQHTPQNKVYSALKTTLFKTSSLSYTLKIRDDVDSITFKGYLCFGDSIEESSFYMEEYAEDETTKIAVYDNDGIIYEPYYSESSDFKATTVIDEFIEYYLPSSISSIDVDDLIENKTISEEKVAEEVNNIFASEDIFDGSDLTYDSCMKIVSDFLDKSEKDDGITVTDKDKSNGCSEYSFNIKWGLLAKSAYLYGKDEKSIATVIKNVIDDQDYEDHLLSNLSNIDERIKMKVSINKDGYITEVDFPDGIESFDIDRITLKLSDFNSIEYSDSDYNDVINDVEKARDNDSEY